LYRKLIKSVAWRQGKDGESGAKSITAEAAASQCASAAGTVGLIFDLVADIAYSLIALLKECEQGFLRRRDI